MKKLVKLLGNSIFLIMLSMWVSGYYALMALQSGGVIAFVFSVLAFTIGYSLYKSELEEG